MWLLLNELWLSLLILEWQQDVHSSSPRKFSTSISYQVNCYWSYVSLSFMWRWRGWLFSFFGWRWQSSGWQCDWCMDAIFLNWIPTLLGPMVGSVVAAHARAMFPPSPYCAYWHLDHIFGQISIDKLLKISFHLIMTGRTPVFGGTIFIICCCFLWRRSCFCSVCLNVLLY